MANNAVYPSMVHHSFVKGSMVGPTIHHTVRHETNSPECLRAQATNTGEDVETFIVQPERTRYLDYADTRSSFAVLLSLAVPQAI